MAMAISSALPCSLLMAALMLLASAVEVQGVTRHYDFNVRRRSIERTTCLHISCYVLLHKMHGRMHAYVYMLIPLVYISCMLGMACMHVQVTMANVTRLCASKSIITVNGQFPGPKIVAREGDRLVIRVTNHAQHNISLHW
jgi:laccase